MKFIDILTKTADYFGWSTYADIITAYNENKQNNETIKNFILRLYEGLASFNLI